MNYLIRTNLEHEYFASINFRDFAKNDKFRAFNFAIRVAFAEVINTTHRRSPLVQGGLEIPVKVVIEIEATAKNRLIIDKYKELVLANFKRTF